MFRKYNKRILTAIVIVIVGIGLIGPGLLLIFAPRQISERDLRVASPEPILDTGAATSSIDSAGGQ